MLTATDEASKMAPVVAGLKPGMPDADVRLRNKTRLWCLVY
jgi:hypothetical protein